MKERCRDGCRTSLLIAGVVLVPAIFHTSLPPCHPYITIHFMEMIFSTCIICFNEGMAVAPNIISFLLLLFSGQGHCQCFTSFVCGGIDTVAAVDLRDCCVWKNGSFFITNYQCFVCTGMLGLIFIICSDFCFCSPWISTTSL